MSDNGDHSYDALNNAAPHQTTLKCNMPKDAIWKNALAAQNRGTPDNDAAHDATPDDTTTSASAPDEAESDDESVDMTGIDNRAQFLEKYFDYMDYKWNGALTYGTLDAEKKWKVLINENGYILEMRTFADYHDLIKLTDALKDALRELAKQDIGITKKIGTEEFRYRQE